MRVHRVSEHELRERLVPRDVIPPAAEGMHFIHRQMDGGIGAGPSRLVLLAVELCRQPLED